MYALLLQDWTTLRGDTTIPTLTQSEPSWLDLTPYQDVIAWLEVKEFTPDSTNIPAIAYQTSPTKDDGLFFNMAPPVVAALGVTTTVMLKDAAPAGCPPVGKWFRWQITVSGSVAWDLTFRIWLAVNAIGNRIAISPATTLADLENTGYRYAYGEPPPTTNSTPVAQQGSGEQTGPTGREGNTLPSKAGVPSGGTGWQYNNIATTGQGAGPNLSPTGVPVPGHRP